MKTYIGVCEDCRFYRPWMEHAGYCKRNAPTQVNSSNEAVFPCVRRRDFCGQGELKEQLVSGSSINMDMLKTLELIVEECEEPLGLSIDVKEINNLAKQAIAAAKAGL